MKGRWLLCGLLPLLVLWVWSPPDSQAYIHMTNSQGKGLFWPDAQVTLNLRLGCRTEAEGGDLPLHGPCWDDAAKHAAQQWNKVGSPFRLLFQSPPDTQANPCSRSDGVNTVAWADTVCGRVSPLAAVLKRTASDGKILEMDVVFNTDYNWSTYSGKTRLNANIARMQDEDSVADFYRVALHEFGHLLGLGHPNAYGQVVQAIMNSGVSIFDIDTLQADDRDGAIAVYGAGPPSAPPTFGSQTIAPQVYTVGRPVSMVLPAATDGRQPLRYTLPHLPAGLHFTADTRTLSGTPTTVQDSGTYRYTVTDAVTAAFIPPRTATLPFTITIEAAPAAVRAADPPDAGRRHHDAHRGRHRDGDGTSGRGRAPERYDRDPPPVRHGDAGHRQRRRLHPVVGDDCHRRRTDGRDRHAPHHRRQRGRGQRDHYPGRHQHQPDPDRHRPHPHHPGQRRPRRPRRRG